MDELRESSLLFSLEGLLETERERVQREAREAERRREEELRRVGALAERRRLAAQQEREARERRRALEEQRERLEQERRDAMREATVERARLEAEAELRQVEVEQARRHELSLLRIREQERAARYQTLAWLTGGAGLLGLLGCAVAYFGFIAPAQARTEQSLRAIVESATGRASAAERALEVELRKNRELADELAAAPNVAEVNAGRTPSPAPSSEGAAKPRRPAVVRPGAVPPARQPQAPASSRACEDNGDPLNACLQGANKRRVRER